jgi:uncharacterized membrane protein YgaE (UPF0421/DUF939 family)
MAKLSEKHHSDEEIATLIHQARGTAAVSIEQNHQERAERFENLATALEQVVNERNELRDAASKKTARKSAGKKKAKKSTTKKAKPSARGKAR